jgi:hypothetical protein
MDNSPDFSITEMVLCGLLIAATTISLIYTGKLIYEESFWDAMYFGGFSLMFASGIRDPLNHVADTLTFPFQIAEPSGRETWAMRIFSILGFGMCCLGWWMAQYD